MEALKKKHYTYEDFLEIVKNAPKNKRYELIFGKIYMMGGASAPHQDILGNIFFKLKQLQYEKKTDCKPRIAPFDLVLECKGEKNIVQPDIILYCKDEKLPCAVFEVLSPSTAYKDKTVKKDLYEFCKIKEYVLVDPLAKTIEIFKLQDNKYIYAGCFGENDKLKLECLKEEINLKEVMEI